VSPAVLAQHRNIASADGYERGHRVKLLLPAALTSPYDPQQASKYLLVLVHADATDAMPFCHYLLVFRTADDD
jgi:hypothetical protein